jgi:tryptophanyl-tRNA synthetase
VPVLAGLDGRKMSKSLGNAIALRDDLDTIVAKIRAARTDSEREITYDPQHRPGVANLITIAALASGSSPEAVAAGIGPAGAAALKAAVVEAVDALLAPIRARRARITDADVSQVLKRGIATAGAIADRTLDEVRTAMGMVVVGV